MTKSLVRQIFALYAMPALLLTATGTRYVYANDVSKGVPLPGLRSSAPAKATTTAASLLLDGDQIALTLDIFSPQSQGAVLTLRMLPFGWLGESEPYPDRQFPELQFKLDNVTLNPQSSFRAFVGAADVTEAIRSAGFDPFVIADTPPFVSSPADHSETMDKLAHQGIVEKVEDRYVAKWTAERNLKLSLNAGKSRLSLAYKARPRLRLAWVP